MNQEIEEKKAEIKLLEQELVNLYKNELLVCLFCKKESKRCEWTLVTHKKVEEHCGYPVHYSVYYSYSIICPECQNNKHLGKELPYLHKFYKQI